MGDISICGARTAQQFADEADGENILVVSHWDAVSGSVARLRPWTISDRVAHTAFTVAYREKKPGAHSGFGPLAWFCAAMVLLCVKNMMLGHPSASKVILLALAGQKLNRSIAVTFVT